MTGNTASDSWGPETSDEDFGELQLGKCSDNDAIASDTILIIDGTPSQQCELVTEALPIDEEFLEEALCNTEPPGEEEYINQYANEEKIDDEILEDNEFEGWELDDDSEHLQHEPVQDESIWPASRVIKWIQEAAPTTYSTLKSILDATAVRKLAAGEHNSPPAKRQRKNPASQKCMGYTTPCTFARYNRGIAGFVLVVTLPDKSQVSIEIGKGVIKVDDVLYVVRKLRRDSSTGNGEESGRMRLHMQQVDTNLTLFRRASKQKQQVSERTLPLALDKGGGPHCAQASQTLIVTSKHTECSVNDLNKLFQEGRVDFQPLKIPIRFMYVDERYNDVLSLFPMDSSPQTTRPPFSMLNSRCECKCGCLAPWLSTSRDSEPSPGDIVEVMPVSQRTHVDECTTLAYVMHSDSQVDTDDLEEDKENNDVEWLQQNTQPSHQLSQLTQTQTSAKGGDEPPLRVQFYRRCSVGGGTSRYTFVRDVRGGLSRIDRKDVLRVWKDRSTLPPEILLADTESQECSVTDALHDSHSDNNNTPTREEHETAIYDLFCGCGMLSLGFERSGAGKTLHAVDVMESALATFSSAHPKAQTHQMDVCQFAQNLSSTVHNADLRQLRQLRMLIGGPPCQGFSGANTSTDAASRLQKNSGFAAFIASIEVLRPDLVCLENVLGLLRARGVLEEAMSALVSLGYQVRVRVFNAGAYGVAQNRMRTILTAARHDMLLPDAPFQTHVFRAGGYDASDPSAPCSLKNRCKAVLTRVPRHWRPNVMVPTWAVLPAIRIKDAIGDLPDETNVGVDVGVRYRTDPRHPYQFNARRDVAAIGGDCPFNHVTIDFSRRRIELDRIRAVPKDGEMPKPGTRWEGRNEVCTHPQLPPTAGDWRDWFAKGLLAWSIPDELAELCDASPEKRRTKAGRYGRLTWDGWSATVLTRSCVQLNSKTSGAVLHPSADRPLSVRETARVQGIPDSLVLSGSVEVCYRQIGNGVPVPLGEAIGRCFKAVAKKWRRERMEQRE